VRKRGSVAHRKQLTRLEYQISLCSCSGTVVQIPSAKVSNLAGMSLCRERFQSDVGTPLRSMLQFPHGLRRAMLSSKTKRSYWVLMSPQWKLPHNILRLWWCSWWPLTSLSIVWVLQLRLLLLLLLLLFLPSFSSWLAGLVSSISNRMLSLRLGTNNGGMFLCGPLECLLRNHGCLSNWFCEVQLWIMAKTLALYILIST
jgi:hypothetical protein